MHDSKIQLETQIRTELEAEYRNNPTKNGNVTELENQLRRQLQQVTEERKRWQFDQEEINKKLINSQVQFGKVRDGFKSTYLYVMPCRCHINSHLSLPILTPCPTLIPLPNKQTEKLDKEKNRYLELEKTNESQIVVIEKLSEEQYFNYF